MDLDLAPIILFVYNRPKHTLETLRALANNQLAEKSRLFIYADGPKDNAPEEDLRRIREVREVIRSEQWCYSNEIIESVENKGLADSIVSGVTEILNRFGKVIVLEDDIVTSQGFLTYMNQALNIYEKEDKVMHIGSYIPETNPRFKLPNTFLSRFMSCWGWATWKDRWENANWDTEYLYQQLSNPKTLYEFNLEGALNFHTQLEDNLNGVKKTWAIKWYTSIFLKKGLCLYPSISLTDNIGLDGSGENCNVQDLSIDLSNDELIRVEKIPILESPLGKQYLKRFYTYGEDSSFPKRFKRWYLKQRYRLIKTLGR